MTRWNKNQHRVRHYGFWSPQTRLNVPFHRLQVCRTLLEGWNTIPQKTKTISPVWVEMWWLLRPSIILYSSNHSVTPHALWVRALSSWKRPLPSGQKCFWSLTITVSYPSHWTPSLLGSSIQACAVLFVYVTRVLAQWWMTHLTISSFSTYPGTVAFAPLKHAILPFICLSCVSWETFCLII